jgi:hypothetical protein
MTRIFCSKEERKLLIKKAVWRFERRGERVGGLEVGRVQQGWENWRE